MEVVGHRAGKIMGMNFGLIDLQRQERNSEAFSSNFAIRHSRCYVEIIYTVFRSSRNMMGDGRRLRPPQRLLLPWCPSSQSFQSSVIG